MPYKVKINFSGLCLFAPENGGTTGPNRMHVLMPNVARHTHGPDRHIPVLYFDIAHLIPGTALSEIYAQVPLRGFRLELGSGGAGLDICPQVANLKPVTGRDVKPELLSGDIHGQLAARVLLAGGEMTGASQGYCWEWESGAARRISHQVEWTIGGLPEVPLQLQVMENESGNGIQPPLPVLHPVTSDDGDVIYLYVHHVPSAELPPERDASHGLMPGQETPHFEAYYSLFGGPVPTRVPRFWSTGADAQITTSHCPVPTGWKGEGAYNCMVAGAW